MSGSSARRRNYMLVKHRSDALVQCIKDMLKHSFVLNLMPTTAADTFSYFEELVAEHRRLSAAKDGSGAAAAARSRLATMVPSIGTFFTDLPLREAFIKYDGKYSICKRRFVTISFNEIRHILNLAQVAAIHDSLKLITFDGDQTLYEDGGNFDNVKLMELMKTLLERGVAVAIVTAASYAENPRGYERRLQGLLAGFQGLSLVAAKQGGARLPGAPPAGGAALLERWASPAGKVGPALSVEGRGRFFVVGGECNYLFKLDPVSCQLVHVPAEDWCPRITQWPAEQVTEILDIAEATLRRVVRDLGIKAKLIRKPRACGIVPGGSDAPGNCGGKKIRRELLDEAVLSVQEALREKVSAANDVPWCAFNGGNDVFVDVGDKRVGVEGLMEHLDIENKDTLHVGDQFLDTGNDFACRAACPTVWITSPHETKYILKELVRLPDQRAGRSVAADLDAAAQGGQAGGAGGGGGAAGAENEAEAGSGKGKGRKAGSSAAANGGQGRKRRKA
eukprot:g2849.t1